MKEKSKLWLLLLFTVSGVAVIASIYDSSFLVMLTCLGLAGFFSVCYYWVFLHTSPSNFSIFGKVMLLVILGFFAVLSVLMLGTNLTVSIQLLPGSIETVIYSIAYSFALGSIFHVAQWLYSGTALLRRSHDSHAERNFRDDGADQLHC